MSGWQAVLVLAVSSVFSLFHIINGSYTGLLQLDIVKSIHLAFAIALTFLLFPARRGDESEGIPIYDLILAAIGFYVASYIALNYTELLKRAAIGYTLTDYIIALLGIIFVLEATRRAVNPALVIVAVAFILYAKFGDSLPFLSHPSYSWKEILEHLYLTKEGVFGTPLAVSATFVVLFVIFGAFLEKSGAGKFFIDLAIALTGRAVGGPAKAAVVASALMGMVSGSSVANTVTTGSFTIPLMKRVGYKPEFAGAVEPAASTGGQIMPPIMGAAAFIMAEFVGMPYSKIALCALIPAILYFFGVFTAVDLEARKENLRGLSDEEIPKVRDVLKRGWYYLLPLAVLIYMLASGYTPVLSAVYSIAVVVAIMVIKPIYENLKAKEPWRLVLKRILKNIIDALSSGGRGVVAVAMACASAGIIVGVVTLTGLGFKIAGIAMDLSQGNFMIVLVLTMIVSLILGMGVPTTANYIITSTIAAPAIISFLADVYGMSVRELVNHPELILPAHMFVFYFGVAADLTPPVALAAYAGSAIAGSDPWKTGINAFKIGIGKYIVPYVFVLTPQLLLIGAGSLSDVLTLITVLAFTALAIVSINGATIGYLFRKCNLPLRIALTIYGFLMLVPDNLFRILGLTLFLITAAYLKSSKNFKNYRELK